MLVDFEKFSEGLRSNKHFIPCTKCKKNTYCSHIELYSDGTYQPRFSFTYYKNYGCNCSKDIYDKYYESEV